MKPSRSTLISLPRWWRSMVPGPRRWKCRSSRKFPVSFWCLNIMNSMNLHICFTRMQRNLIDLLCNKKKKYVLRLHPTPDAVKLKNLRIFPTLNSTLFHSLIFTGFFHMVTEQEASVQGIHLYIYSVIMLYAKTCLPWSESTIKTCKTGSLSCLIFDTFNIAFEDHKCLSLLQEKYVFLYLQFHRSIFRKNQQVLVIHTKTFLPSALYSSLQKFVETVLLNNVKQNTSLVKARSAFNFGGILTIFYIPWQNFNI